MIRGARFVGLVLVLILFTAAVAQGAPELVFRHPQPGPGHLLGLIFAGGQFVAVGQNGALLTSVDGVEWQQAVVNQSLYLQGVAYGNGRYVAAGAGGVVLVSDDGRTWARRPDLPGPVLAVGSLVFAGGRFGLMASDQDRGVSMFTSEDGVNWTAGKPPALQGEAMLPRLHSDGSAFFYPVGNRILRSADLLVWQEAGRLPGEMMFMGPYVGGRWFASGLSGILSSSDLTTWRTEGRWLTGVWGVARGPDRFVLATTHGAVTVPDAGEAVSVRSPGPFSNQLAVAYGNGIYVAIGLKGYLATSPDGVTWTERAPGSRAHISGLAAGNGRLVAVGTLQSDFDTSVLTSGNGLRWQTAPGVKGWLVDVAFGAGRFVAVGTSGELVSSADGLAWSSHAVPDDVAPRFSAVVHDGTRFLAFSWDGIYASESTEQWVRLPAPSVEGTFSRVIYAGGLLVAVGERSGRQAVIATSPDGATWTDRSPGIEGRLTGVAYGDGRFVAVGEGLVLTSADGAAWAADTRAVRAEWRDVAFAGGGFFGLTESGVYGLEDAAATGTGPVAQGMSWGGRRLLAVGDRLIAGGEDGLVATGVVWQDQEGYVVMPDVPASHPAARAIRFLFDQGLLLGKSPTEMAPQVRLTRAEAATLLARVFGWELRPG